MNATIDVNLLATFVAVADAASFSRAAEKLGTTTATVSRSIARLESELDAALIHRTTRRLSLSTAGLALYERAAAPMRALAEAVKELPEREEEPAGLLRLTAPFDLGVTLLPETLTRFEARYPRIRLELELTNRAVDIVGERFDVALRGGGTPKVDPSLTVRKLVGAQMFRFHASPTYIARRGTPRAAGESDHEWLVMAGLERHPVFPKGFEPRVVANEFLFLTETARAGAGVALLPTLFGDRHAASGDLVRVLPPVRTTGGLSLIYRGGARIPRKVAAFRDFIVDAIRRQVTD